MTPEKIKQSMHRIDRKDFVLSEDKEHAYENRPLSIGYGATISQPYTVNFMLNLLKLKKGQKILDIGSGSGWTTALIADLIGSKGQVFGTEIIPELVKFGKKNLEKYKFKNAKIFLTKKLGLKKYAPFDRILVSACANNLPQELISQLKTNGLLVIPIKNSIWQIKKISNNKLEKHEYPGFVFVPLQN